MVTTHLLGYGTTRVLELHSLGAQFGLWSASRPAPIAKFAYRVNQRYPKTSMMLNSRLWIEQSENYDSDFQKLGPGVELIGYFQSWKYFQNIRQILVKEIRNVTQPTRSFLRTQGSSEGPRRIAVHVRRGDYTQPSALRLHGVLPLSYYRQALERLGPTRHDLIQVYSDDPHAFREIQSLLGDEFQVINMEAIHDMKPIERLVTMSNATAIITANSSFSWWAAYTADESTNVTVPLQWYAGRDYSPGDRFLPSWSVVPS